MGMVSFLAFWCETLGFQCRPENLSFQPPGLGIQRLTRPVRADNEPNSYRDGQKQRYQTFCLRTGCSARQLSHLCQHTGHYDVYMGLCRLGETCPGKALYTNMSSHFVHFVLFQTA